ncbi:hypothetical protein LCGC14_1064020 [marine sediment metagenome]|uniref:Uncharacterized protein n=1 Tax=marine sediment metagenome TaxID=412755 RepID=A0A0F9MPX7_9ZZZZ
MQVNPPVPAAAERIGVLLNPRIGQRAQVWYRAGVRDHMPLHGKVGTIVMRANSRKPSGPRNHGIEIDGIRHVVPCGNLNSVKD